MNALTLIKTAASTLFNNKKIVFFPYLILLFLYLFSLEIIYFIPFKPITTFLGPIIEKLFGEVYLHYPYNLALLPKVFQHSQIAIFLVFGSFLIPAAIDLVVQLNNEQKVSLKRAFLTALANYVFIFVVLLMMVACLIWKMELFGLLIKRAQQIQSTSGKFWILKQSIIQGASYVNLILDIFIQSLFALIVPICIVYKRKIVAAFISNFRMLASSWKTVFMIIFIPSMLYVPILVVRELSAFKDAFPEISLLLVVFSVFVSIFVDAVIYTSLTVLCLYKKESS